MRQSRLRMIVIRSLSVRDCCNTLSPCLYAHQACFTCSSGDNEALPEPDFTFSESMDRQRFLAVGPTLRGLITQIRTCRGKILSDFGSQRRKLVPVRFFGRRHVYLGVTSSSNLTNFSKNSFQGSVHFPENCLINCSGWFVRALSTTKPWLKSIEQVC